MSNQRDMFSAHASDSADALAYNHATDSYFRYLDWQEPKDSHLWFIWQADNGNPPSKLVDESNAQAIADAMAPFMPNDVFEIHGCPDTLYAVRVWREVKRYYAGPAQIFTIEQALKSYVTCQDCYGHKFDATRGRERCQRCGGEGQIFRAPLEDDAERLLGKLYKAKEKDQLQDPQEIIVRVLTKAFETVNEIACALSEYPLLDESDHSEREYVDGLDQIKSEGRGVDESSLPAGYRWERMVFSWLSDHNQHALERDEDGRYCPSEEDISEALYYLGLMREEDREEWEDSHILGARLWHVCMNSKGEICYFSGDLELKRAPRNKTRAQRRRFMLRQIQRRLGRSQGFTAYLGCGRAWVNTLFVTTQRLSDFRPELPDPEGHRRIIHSFRVHNNAIVGRDVGKVWKRPGAIIDSRRRAILEGLQAQQGQYQAEALKSEARQVELDKEVHAAYEASKRGHRIGEGRDGTRIYGGTFRPREGLPGQTGAVCQRCNATVTVDLDTGTVSGTVLDMDCRKRTSPAAA
jgi:hypothetical protein